MNQRTRLTLLLFLITITLTIQVPAMLKVHIVEYDEAIFLDVARNIRRSGLPIRSIGAEGIFFFDHTSLYVYLLSLYATSNIFFFRLITTIFSLGCVILVFLIGERIGSTSAGTVASLLQALSPFTAVYAFFIRMEIPMVFSMLLGLWLIAKWEQDGSELLLCEAGLALSIAALFKEFALLFTFVCVTSVIYKCLQRRIPIWKPLFYILAPTMIGILAWSVWCWNLAPSTFNSALCRWINSATVQNVVDPRLGVPISEWIHKIASDLLGNAITIGIIASLSLLLIRRKRLSIVHSILVGYPVAAIGLSFVIQLKELRHIIGVIPVAALLTGVSIDWEQILAWGKSNQWKAYMLIAGAVLGLLLASPFRVPTQNPVQIEAWLNPIYARRVFNNDSYYNTLALVGLYIHNRSEPNEIITVVNEGPVVGYYADRHYNILYTLPDEESVILALHSTHYLVWDRTVFPNLDDEQIQAVQDYVAQAFEIEEVMQDDYRQIIIYVKRDGQK